jgi:tRNA1(Val) A37 N6-methylase TrmN6
VIEGGAGAGAAALCLAARVSGCRVTGVEIQPDLVRLASENAALNGLQGRIEVLAGDVASPPHRLAPSSFAHAMLNPPFHRAAASDAPPAPGKAVAQIESEEGLSPWIDFALRMVRPKGSLTLIHRADRLADILAALNGRAGEIVVFPLWPGRDGKPSKRVIVRARKDIATPLRLAPGMALHEADGRFTADADAVLRGAALNL